MQAASRRPFRYWIALRAMAAALLILAMCTGSNAQNAPQITQLKASNNTPLLVLSAWEDPSDAATLQQVQNTADWVGFTGWKSFGFGGHPIWIRLHLTGAENDNANPWVVVVRPPLLDALTLYDPQNGTTQQLGNAVSPDEDALGSVDFAFQIPAVPHERDIYLRLQTTSTRTLHLEVRTFRQAQVEGHQQEWLRGFTLSLSLIFALWALSQWWQTRESVVGAFAVKQLFAAFWAFLYLGFARIMLSNWLPPGVLRVLMASVFALLITATIWFMRKLIQTYQPSPMWLKLCNAVAAGCAVLPLMQLAGLTLEMRMIANASALLGLTVLLGTLLSARHSNVRPPFPYRYLLIYLGLYCLINTPPPMVYLGLLKGNDFLMMSVLVIPVLDGLIMFLLLQVRARAMQKAQRHDALEALRSQAQAVAEKRQREDQGQLFAMLAHEMKTPLATLRMWMETGRLNRDTLERAVTDMNQVIERCVHTAQLADQGLKPSYQPLDAVALTQSCITACQAPERVQLQAQAMAQTLHADSQMLAIVLSNLLDNACKYSAPDSQVALSLQPASGAQGQSGLQWRVTNQAGAAGLPDPELLFGKYYRSPQARRQSGSGLGLFLVKGLLELMHGTIHYCASADHATFTLWLPHRPQDAVSYG